MKLLNPLPSHREVNSTSCRISPSIVSLYLSTILRFSASSLLKNFSGDGPATDIPGHTLLLLLPLISYIIKEARQLLAKLLGIRQSIRGINYCDPNHYGTKAKDFCFRMFDII